MHLTILWVVALSRPVEICQGGDWGQQSDLQENLPATKAALQQGRAGQLLLKWHIP